MSDDDIRKLVARLRATFFGERDFSLHDVRDAANALEALAAECDLVRSSMRSAVAERDRLKAVLVRTAASLAAAISLLETDGKAAKKAAPSDKMFKQMLADYNHALGDARKALEAKDE